ncbi:MAG: enoyl-CoA hydratase/isomerase family protein [Frankia sp.]|nr:enoyl-CoA hydratase/isomerase family protein [Frankia sp.]
MTASPTGTTGNDEAELVTERSGSTLIARLNRPAARNALTPNLIAGIGAAVVEAESDPEIRALIITGTGDRAFCAGMDLKAFSSGTGFNLTGDEDEEAKAAREANMSGYNRLAEGTAGVPVICAANGTAVGGGFELLLSCDLVVASSAAKFGLPEVRRGLIAAGGGMIMLGNRLPRALAMEFSLVGDYIDASRALELGLVNQVVAADEVRGAAVALAERIAENGPLAVSATKELVQIATNDAPAATRRLREVQGSIFGSEDAKEGAMAFIEKRKPIWKGR